MTGPIPWLKTRTAITSSPDIPLVMMQINRTYSLLKSVLGGTVFVKIAIKITKNYDGGYSISKTYDGGYIIGGEAGHSHNEDFMLLKVDADGTKLWSKRFTDQEDDAAFDMLEAKDGNHYLVGSKRIIYKYEDIRIIKTDSIGTKNLRQEFRWEFGRYRRGNR